MPIPHLPRRIAALWLALVFLLSTAGEGFGYPRCPHHTPAPADAAAAHAAHQAHADAGHDTPAPEHSGHHSGPCTCLGLCQAASGAAMLGAPAPAQIQAVVRQVAEAPAVGRELHVPHHQPHLLPYAQAPPAAC